MYVLFLPILCIYSCMYCIRYFILIPMYRVPSYCIFIGNNTWMFYFQVICDIVFWCSSSICFSFFGSVYVGFHLGDGLNDFSMSIGSTRFSSDNVHTHDSTTYSHCLKNFYRPPVCHKDTIITSFDIPCSL
jgi:hypothetical protein